MQQGKPDKEVDISYIDDINSQQYISQFLDFTAYTIHDDCYSQQVRNYSEQYKTQIANHNATSLSIRSQEIELSDEETRRSGFHNFQKHLVTTLRNCIDFKQMRFEDDERELEQSLWSFFINCPRMTRTLIYLVFGGINIDCLKARKFNKNYGLEKIIRGYSASRIKRAQKNLRNETLKQIALNNFNQKFESRRMKNKQGFKLYFETFMEQLRDGGFNKRLPKQKKQKIEKKQLFEQQGNKKYDLSGSTCCKD